MKSQSNLINLAVRSVLTVIIVLLLVAGKSLLIPLAWSLLITLASVNLIDRVEKKTVLSRGLVIFLFLLFMLIILSLIGYFFYVELSHIFEDMHAISQKLSIHLHNLSLFLNEKGIHIPDHIDKKYINDWIHHHNNLVFDFISEIGTEIWNIILIIFYLFFLLYYRYLLPYFFTRKITDKAKLASMEKRFRGSMALIRGYIQGLLLLTLVSAILNYFVFLIFGLRFAMFFAVFLAILNLIPFIGNPAGLVVVMLYALITKDSILIPLLIFVALFVMNFIQDNVLRPWLIGDKMKLNAFAVFLSIILGGMIWGISGMILFIPVAGIIKILLEGHEIHGPYAILFSALPRKTKVNGPASDGT